ncbi:MAG TPA: hypothetical protein VIH61_02300 [Waddliaceae bacterium]
MAKCEEKLKALQKSLLAWAARQEEAQAPYQTTGANDSCQHSLLSIHERSVRG